MNSKSDRQKLQKKVTEAMENLLDNPNPSQKEELALTIALKKVEAIGTGSKVDDALFNAIMQDDTVLAEKAIKDGADLERVTERPYRATTTPLGYAVTYKKTAVTRLLLDKGASLTHALEWAEEEGNVKAIMAIQDILDEGIA